MVNQWAFKILLAPLALLYGIGVSIFSLLYATGLLKGVRFNLPVISVGNLSVGGTGKTPHVEYLLRLLREHIQMAVVSRGYKRKTSGYLEVQMNMDARQTGDEPLQFKRKFPETVVAVAESRSLAIPQIIRHHPSVQTIIMDDGFQHREVKPGLNILLTEYANLYSRDFLLPVGRLREWRSGASRADIIVVTKCPPDLSQQEQNKLTQEVRRKPSQSVFFSRFIYGQPYKMYSSAERISLHKDLPVLVVAAIAGTEYLMDYIASEAGEVRLMEFTDHYAFAESDLRDIKRHFDAFSETASPIILTTEKDAMRLDSLRAQLLPLQLPIYILPVAVRFMNEGEPTFDDTIRQWLLDFKS